MFPWWRPWDTPLPGKGCEMGKTDPVRRLVERVLDGLPELYTEDVIDEVFRAIEHDDELRRWYDGCCEKLGKETVNSWGGNWIKKALGEPKNLGQVASKRNTLTDSYSRLDVTEMLRSRKRRRR